MRYSVLSGLCLFAAMIRPVFVYRFVKDIICGEVPYRSGTFLSIDGLIFVLWFMEVSGSL